MADNNVDWELRIRTQGAMEALRKVDEYGKGLFERRGFRLNVKSSGAPLGTIGKDFTSFGKSLDAATERVVAFTSVTTLIYGVGRAFQSLVKDTIAVEKSLATIQSILQVSSSELKSFSTDLFAVANKTGTAFDDAASAALEFSRQGLGLKKTIEATTAALTFSRIAGIDAAKAVQVLTAEVNTFNAEGLSYIDVVDKITALDNNFAASAAGIAEGLKRVGSVASDTGSSLSELGALITSVQQITARGEAVIGNGLKTIFTRVQRAGVQEQLEQLGVVTKEATGEFRPLIDVLSDLSKVYQTLGDSQQASIIETVGGVFQANTLRATLKALSGEYGTYARALNVAENASGDADSRLKILNNTTATALTQLQNNLKEFNSVLGGQIVGPILNKFIGEGNKLFSGLKEGAGSEVGKAILSGISNALEGPGVAVILAIIGKLFRKVASDAGKGLSSILGINKETQISAELQNQVNQAIATGNAELVTRLALTKDVVTQNVILNELLAQQNTVQNLKATEILVKTGLAANKVPRGASGLLPAIVAESKSISQGVGGASASAQPVVKRLNLGRGFEPAVLNTDEYIVRNYAGGGLDAVFNKKMISAAGGIEALKKFGKVEKVKNYAGGSDRAGAIAQEQNKLLALEKRLAKAALPQEKVELQKKIFAQEAKLSTLTQNYTTSRGAYIPSLPPVIPPPSSPVSRQLPPIVSPPTYQGMLNSIVSNRNNAASFLASSVSTTRYGGSPGSNVAGFLGGSRASNGAMPPPAPPENPDDKAAKERRKADRANKALLASFIIPSVTAGITSSLFDQSTQAGRSGTRLFNGVSAGLGSGLAFGALTNPAIGAIIGGFQILDTVLKKDVKTFEDMRIAADKVVSSNNKQSDSVQRAIQSRQNIEDLIAGGAPQSKIDSERSNFADALGGIGNRSVIDAITDTNPKNSIRNQQVIESFQQSLKRSNAAQEFGLGAIQLGEQKGKATGVSGLFNSILDDLGGLAQSGSLVAKLRGSGARKTLNSKEVKEAANSFAAGIDIEKITDPGLIKRLTDLSNGFGSLDLIVTEFSDQLGISEDDLASYTEGVEGLNKNFENSQAVQKAVAAQLLYKKTLLETGQAADKASKATFNIQKAFNSLINAKILNSGVGNFAREQGFGTQSAIIGSFLSANQDSINPFLASSLQSNSETNQIRFDAATQRRNLISSKLPEILELFGQGGGKSSIGFNKTLNNVLSGNGTIDNLVQAASAALPADKTAQFYESIKKGTLESAAELKKINIKEEQALIQNKAILEIQQQALQDQTARNTLARNNILSGDASGSILGIQGGANRQIEISKALTNLKLPNAEKERLEIESAKITIENNRRERELLNLNGRNDLAAQSRRKELEVSDFGANVTLNSAIEKELLRSSIGTTISNINQNGIKFGTDKQNRLSKFIDSGDTISAVEFLKNQDPNGFNRGIQDLISVISGFQDRLGSSNYDRAFLTSQQDNVGLNPNINPVFVAAKKKQDELLSEQETLGNIVANLDELSKKFDDILSREQEIIKALENVEKKSESSRSEISLNTSLQVTGVNENIAQQVSEKLDPQIRKIVGEVVQDATGKVPVNRPRTGSVGAPSG